MSLELARFEQIRLTLFVSVVMIPKKVLILMATYNGSRYLGQQIKSIQNQEHKKWELLVRDDDSCDKTQGLLEEIARKESRLKLISDGLGRLGPADNFGVLMQFAYRTGANYVMFADQDDVWLPDKISRQMQLMEELEQVHGDIPILVHSDLAVVDKHLKRIHSSLMAYQGIHHESTDPLKVLLVQNFVTSCATLVNRHLLQVVQPLPKGVLMHDWWLAQCAAACGLIGYIKDATVLYRQHGENIVGAKSYRMIMNPFNALWIKTWRKGIHNLSKSIQQAQCLSQRLAERGFYANKANELVDSYASIMELSPLQRLQKIKCLSIHKQNHIKQLLLYVHIMFMQAYDIHE